jgi:peptidoglycan/xylan/chitin deacetylase (PgdA/CDA1 family)
MAATDPGEDADVMASTAEGSAKSAELATMPLVLMYHSVSPYDEDPYGATIAPERFERHMRWLRGRGLRGVSMAELLSATAAGRGRGLVGLTFDDGYQDFITYAMPVLQQYCFTATAFVLAGRLGGHDAWNRPGPVKALLTADQVCQVAKSGMEIGSHGLDHVALPEADDTRLSAETVRSRAILHELIGQQVRGFCYPYGPSPAIGLHAIPRTYVHDHDSSWRLDAKRIRSGLTVGNRIAVRRHRGKARSSQVEYL